MLKTQYRTVNRVCLLRAPGCSPTLNVHEILASFPVTRFRRFRVHNVPAAELKTVDDFRAAAAKANAVLTIPDWEQKPKAVEAIINSAIAKANKALDRIGRTIEKGAMSCLARLRIAVRHDRPGAGRGVPATPCPGATVLEPEKTS